MIGYRQSGTRGIGDTFGLINGRREGNVYTATGTADGTWRSSNAT